MSELAVKVTNLTKQFKSTIAVDDISFSVATGEFVGLLGGNGAGKTTTISMLLGLLIPDAGKIEILGQDFFKHRYELLSKMNFSSPYVDLPKRLMVMENLSFYARLYGIHNVYTRVSELAEELDLGDLLEQRYGSLSAGQKTRVMLAKALLNKPKLLLLDEPTVSLDPDVADRLRSLLVNYVKSSKSTVLLASHNMREVEQLCSSVLIMDKGRIIDCGKPVKLYRRYNKSNMEQVYLHLARRKA